MELVTYEWISEADESSRVAGWLASDLSDYIVGTTIYADGGMTVYPGLEKGG